MVAGQRRRPTATRSSLIDATSGAGGLPVDVARRRRLLLRPAEVLRRRRRPVARAAEPGRAGAHRGDRARSDRWIPEFLSLATALDNSRKDQTYNTPAVATLLLLADQIEWMLGNGGLDWCVERTTAVLGAPLRLGREQRRSRPRSSPSRPSARWSSARSTSTSRSTPRPSPRRCAPTASSTSSRTASSAATSCASAMFPAIEPDDVEALTACIDYVVEQPGMTRSWSPRRSAPPGSTCCASTSTSTSASTDDLDRIGEYDGILIRSATKMTAELHRAGARTSR